MKQNNFKAAIPRRSFLQGSALFLTQLWAKAWGDDSEIDPIDIQKERDLGPFSIIQGLTDQTTTQISILTNKHQELKITLKDLQTNVVAPPEFQKLKIWASRPEEVIQVGFKNLNPQSSYELSICDQSGKVLDWRRLKTMDTDLESARIAVVSCAKDHSYRAYMWDKLRGQAPNCILMIGDNVYGDNPSDVPTPPEDGPNPGPNPEPEGIPISPQFLWQRYAETRNMIEFYRERDLIPVLAIWDDHDYGKNNGDSTFKWKVQSKKIFESFFAQEHEFTQNSKVGVGVGYCFSAFKSQFLMLDGRYFRTEAGISGEASMFGMEQEYWILEQLRNHPGPFYLVNGVQWFAPYKKSDSYSANLKDNFDKMIARIKASGKKVIFISGDIHFSEIMELEPEVMGYKTYEVTSSAIHSGWAPGFHLLFPNKRRIEATSARNFVIMDHKIQNKNWDIETTSLGFVAWRLMHAEMHVDL